MFPAKEEARTIVAAPQEVTPLAMIPPSTGGGRHFNFNRPTAASRIRATAAQPAGNAGSTRPPVRAAGITLGIRRNGIVIRRPVSLMASNRPPPTYTATALRRQAAFDDLEDEEEEPPRQPTLESLNNRANTLFTLFRGP